MVSYLNVNVDLFGNTLILGGVSFRTLRNGSTKKFYGPYTVLLPQVRSAAGKGNVKPVLK